MRPLVVAALAVLALALAACGGDSSETATGSTAAPAAAAAAQECPSRTPRVALTARAQPGVRAVAADGPRVWAASERTGSVTGLSATSGAVERTVDGIRTPVALAAGLGGVWVADQDRGRVWRIDPETGRLKAITDLGLPVDLAIVGNQLWMLSLDDGSLYAYRPSGGFISIPDLGLPVKAPSAMAPMGDTLWVLGSGDSSVLGLNTRLRRVVEGGVPLDANSLSDVATGAGAVWVADPKDVSILRVDPGTRGVTAFRAPGGFAPTALAVTGCGVWATDPSGLVARFDPATLRIVGRPVRVGASTAGITPDGGNGVWVTDPRGGRVVHVVP